VIASLIKKLLRATPFRIVRSAPNRFQEIDHCLRHLRRLGYEPKIVIDGGAYLGSFALAAHTIFSTAVIHMIEPQPACKARLTKLSSNPDFTFHPFALSARRGTLPMVCDDPVPCTGAHLAWPETLSQASVIAEVTTLDDLFASKCKTTDRTLLKLDLQGHELLALQGASVMLPLVEVVLAEVSFFQAFGEPKVRQLIEFFGNNGFEIFDVAALSSRIRDDRLRQGDLFFVRRDSQLLADNSWA
jgi:FkbM family methyltransferase